MTISKKKLTGTNKADLKRKLDAFKADPKVRIDSLTELSDTQVLISYEYNLSKVKQEMISTEPESEPKPTASQVIPTKQPNIPIIGSFSVVPDRTITDPKYIQVLVFQLFLITY